MRTVLFLLFILPTILRAQNSNFIPFVNPLIIQVVAGAVTVQVLAGIKATPELSKAITVNDVGDSPAAAPTVIVALPLLAAAEIVGALNGVVPAKTFDVNPVFPLFARIAT